MKKWTVFILLCIFLLPGCAAPRSDAPTVAATTAPLYQFAQALCQGTGIEVELVISDTVSCIHDYSLTVGQMRIVESADCVLLSGAGLEDFMEDALAQADTTIDCSEGIGLLELEGGPDPHIWLSPKNAAQMARNAAKGLSALYPQWADTLEENLGGLLEKLDDLQLYGEAELENLSTREMITFHEGFAYFAQAFGLEVLAAIEEESGSEASAAVLADISELVLSHNLPAVFTEENGSNAAAGAISRETGCQVFTLSMILSGGDYFEWMEQNIDTIKEAMG